MREVECRENNTCVIMVNARTRLITPVPATCHPIAHTHSHTRMTMGISHALHQQGLGCEVYGLTDTALPPRAQSPCASRRRRFHVCALPGGLVDPRVPQQQLQRGVGAAELLPVLIKLSASQPVQAVAPSRQRVDRRT